MRVALLEDEAAVAEVVRGWLKEAGHECFHFANGKDLIRIAARESFDLAILDWMVPGLDGPGVLAWLRQNVDYRVPVIFVTSRDSEDDLVTALSAGADDYIVKPLRRMELIARVAAVLRRANPQALAPHAFDLGGLRVDPQHREISRDGTAIDLTEKEFDLAAFLLKQPGRLLSRNHILEAVWGKHGGMQTRTVDTHMSRLRVKLGLRPENGLRLTAVHSVGYRLEVLEGGAA